MSKSKSERIQLSADARGKRVVFTADAKFTLKKFAAGTETAKGPAKIATLTGYALLWNVLSTDRGGYKVRLKPGSAAFADSTLALFHHDFAKPLGNTSNGTLRILAADDTGVKVEIDLPDTTAGRDVEELVERGDVKGMSFAMVESPVSDVTTEGGQTVVNCSSYLVDEVTVTAIPAFTQTTVDVTEDDEDEFSDDEGAADFAKKNPAAAKEFTRQRMNLQALRLSTTTL